MNLGIVSARYAKALLKFAIERGEEDAVYRDMQSVVRAYLAFPQIATALANPALSLEQSEALMLAAVGEEVSESTRRFVAFVLKRHRQKMMQFIANSYIQHYRSYKHIVVGKLTLPIDNLPSNLMDRMKKWVEKQTHDHVDFTVEHDASIGGGFILEYDTYRLDASLKNQLRQVKKALQA